MTLGDFDRLLDGFWVQRQDKDTKRNPDSQWEYIHPQHR